MNTKLENFEVAFRAGTGGITRVCDCGKVFYNQHAGGYEEGELASLMNDPGSVALDHDVADIRFQGRNYVDVCGCWREKAEAFILFIERHASQIARYLTLEKKRKQEEADASPTVGA